MLQKLIFQTIESEEPPNPKSKPAKKNKSKGKKK